MANARDHVPGMIVGVTMDVTESQFSSKLRDKIWEWPGNEAKLQAQEDISSSAIYPQHSL